MKITDGYTKKEGEYTPLTYAEIKAGIAGHVEFISTQKTARRAKVTSIKTWKTRPEIEIHIKYGLYENGITTVYPDGHFTGVTLIKKEVK